MKARILFLLISGLCTQSGLAQFSFSDASTRLGNQTIRSGAAMGVVDMNNDGLDDIIRLDQAQTLYISYQASNGNFSNFNAGVLQGTQWSLCVADVDRNNFNDIFTGGSYNNLKLIRADNAGSTYSINNITAPPIFLQGSNFADINRDGLADIFACHDDGLSLPLRNAGAGAFVVDYNLINPVSTIPSDNSGNYGSVWIDFNNDRRLDLYISKCREGVTNPLDGRRLNLLFRNNGNGTFTEVAESAGLRPLAQSWAADFADIDNDGDLDCFLITHDSPCRLYMNNGLGFYTEITSTSGLLTSLSNTGPGLQVKFEDFDNDGYVDLLYTAITGTHLLFRNNGNRTFTNVPNAFPTGGARIHSATTGDLDNNGYMDVYAGFGSGYNTPGTTPDKLFLNQNTGRNFFKVRLRGTASNINGIGARLELYGSWGRQIREVRSGESYGIMSTFTRHFGLGFANSIDSLLVRWPSGVVDRVVAPAINQTLVLQEASNCVLSINFSHLVNGSTVAFQDQSTLGATQWLWNFGDGSTSTQQNPTHTYSNPGLYQVCLTVQGVCGGGFYCTTINVNCLPPVPNFSTQNATGFTVQFNDLTTNQPTQWLWNFGDGTTSNAQNPTHTYPAAGVYVVCLTVINACGSGQYCQLVQAGCSPGQVGYQANVTNLSVVFSGFASLPALQWRWTFGDGQTSNQQNPTHTYALPGTYQVCLEVTNVCGTISVCDSIPVSCPPPAAGYSTQVMNLSVLLQDLSVGNPTNWLWTFGDGTSSNVANPAHTYAAPGTYQICLQVSNLCGSTQVCQSITFNCQPPVSAFSVQQSGFTLTLTDLSFNNPTQWSWSVNGAQFSTQQNPQLTLPGPGAYQICLQASSICGTGATICQTVIAGCPTPVAAFNFQANGLTVNFNDQSLGSPTAWTWTFGNGASSTQQNPQVTYSAPGTYQVCLQATNACGPGAQVCQNITVNCPAPSAAFGIQANGLTVSLTDQSTGNPTQWAWNFGNGTTSTQQNPQVTYAAPGTYQICLQASSICGTGAQLCQSVTVGCTAPVAAFSIQANGLTVSLTDQSTGNPTQWAWNFGNGTTSTQQNPQVAYASPGTYQICLQATNICGTGAQFCQNVSVTCPAPQAAFAYTVNGLQVSFTDNSTGMPAQRVWSFGDGNISTQQNPVHTYAASGSYLVCLQAANICGTNIRCDTVTIGCAPPVAAFSITTAGTLLLFVDVSQNNPTQWLWNFGDGTISTEQNPLHLYPQNGIYQVCLIVSNACGIDTICQNAVVGPVSAYEPPAGMKVNAYPNPANELLTVEVGDALPGEAVVELIDSRGRLANRWRYYLGTGVQRLALPVEDMPPGLYWLTLYTVQGRVSYKIVIAR